jgi:hypothetical protein
MASSPVRNIFIRERNISYMGTIYSSLNCSNITHTICSAISAYVKAIVYVEHAPVHVFAPHQVNLLALDENMCFFLITSIVIVKCLATFP